MRTGERHVSTVGSLNEPGQKEESIASGKAGVVETARVLIKVMEGRNAEGWEQLVEGRTVICAVGQRSRKRDALPDAAPFVRVIGDAVRPSTITTAVYQGRHAGLDV